MSISEPTEVIVEDEISNLKGFLETEYPQVEISYHDYTNLCNRLIGNKVEMDTIFETTQHSPESFVSPFGIVTGKYRAELFVHCAKHSIEDPLDSNNRILIYPSFDLQKKLTKLRILKYPKQVTDQVIKQYHKHIDELTVPNDTVRIMKAPQFRVGQIDNGSGDTMSMEYLLNIDKVRIIRYSQDRILNMKRSIESIKWGENSIILPYKNRRGDNILLVLNNS